MALATPFLSCLLALPVGLAEDGQAESESQPAEAADEQAPAEEFVVEDSRTVVRALPGATVTTLDVASESARVLDLGDLLASAPGVRVRSTGGVGSAQLVQLRGATGGEVRVLVDGVPLPQDAAGAVDLSSLPLESVERIEVYRGTLPLGLGGEGVAGAINLVTRQPRGLGELRLTGAAGSFHTYEGTASVDLGRRHWRYGAWLAGGSARNDFGFHDDNGTPYTGADDQPDALRQNADVQRLEAGGRAVREGEAGRLATSVGALLRDAGVPGPASYQLSTARLAQRRVTLSAKHEAGETLLHSVGLGGHLDATHYQDEAGEVGLGAQDERSLAWSLAVDGLLDWRFWDQQHLALALRAEEQGLAADNALDQRNAARRHRERLSATLEARGAWRVLGYGARLAMDGASSGGDGSVPMVTGEEREGIGNFLASPSASLSVHPAQWLGLRAAGGMAHRLPTFPELYGDAGTIVGNEGLRPERGTSVDAGTDLGLRLGAEGTGVLSVTGWFRSVQDLIAYVQNSQYTLRAENFERVQLWGVEAEGGLALPAGRLGTLDSSVAYGWTRSRNMSENAATEGAALPGLPEHELFVDFELGGALLEPGASFELQGMSFRDSANLQRVPARAFLHLRLASKPWRRGPELGVEVRNVLDHRTEQADIVDLSTGDMAVQAVSDFLGYPLPGRAIFASVDWSWAP